jgi:hypothetical protein
MCRVSLAVSVSSFLRFVPNPVHLIGVIDGT